MIDDYLSKIIKMKYDIGFERCSRLKTELKIDKIGI